MKSKKNHPINARFHAWINAGPVKLTLKPGQELHWFKGQETDEGWCSMSITWAHELNMIRRIVICDGKDCDGRLTRTMEDFCSLDDLNCGYPDWKKASDFVYDQYAQLSGY